MRRLIAFFVMLVACSTASIACKCAPPSADLTTPLAVAEWRMQGMPFIFEGKVQEVEIPGWPLKPVPGHKHSNLPYVLVTFSEVKFHRGERSGTVQVATGLGPGDCGYPFEIGESYLVFAYMSHTNGLTTSICTGTTLLEDAGTALRLLRGEPATPDDLRDRRNTKFSGDEKSTGEPKLCGKIAVPGSVPRSAIGAVTVLLWRDGEKLLPFRVEATEPTEDGSFCFRDLPAGKYILAAQSEPAHGVRYAAYFPGTTRFSQAGPVDLSKPQSGAQKNLTLLRERLYTIRGYVRGLPQNQQGKVLVTLVSRFADPLHILPPLEVGPHGRFEIRNIAAGSYMIFAGMDDEDDTTTDLTAALEIEVTGNIDGLKLEYALRTDQEPPKP